MKLTTTLLSIALIIMTTSCQKTELIPPSDDLSFLDELTDGSNKARPRPQTWVDCELFDGVVTPATFDPDAGNFDELYAGGSGFKDGKPLISESKPGDQDYNGGRWHMNELKSSVDADKYQNACTVEDLDLNDFNSTENYFECPLLPRRGNNN